MVITFALLACSIASVWWPKTSSGSSRSIAPWMGLYAAAVIAGVIASVLTGAAVIALVVMAGICVTSIRWGPRPGAWFWPLAAGGLGLALALHALPGFHNPLLVSAVRTSPDAVPFTLYANFDKASVGLLLLACFAPRVTSLSEVRGIAMPTVAAAAATAAVSIGVAWAAGYVRPEYKLLSLPPFTPEFMFVNLFFTCMAEEAFFRGLIQERLTRAVASRPRLSLLPVLSSAILFGLAHVGGGMLYVALATLAGLGYAGVYAKTRRVEAAVLTHFAVNATHFLFFTYPALSK